MLQKVIPLFHSTIPFQWNIPQNPYHQKKYALVKSLHAQANAKTARLASKHVPVATPAAGETYSTAMCSMQLNNNHATQREVLMVMTITKINSVVSSGGNLGQALLFLSVHYNTQTRMKGVHTTFSIHPLPHTHLTGDGSHDPFYPPTTTHTPDW